MWIARISINGLFTDYIARLRFESSDDATRKVAMDLVNPKFILRNHLAQNAIEKAQSHDFAELNTILAILTKPFDEQTAFHNYSLPPPEGELK